ncbi:tRNA U34 5-carboxymethylaminomethyl modifying GTPase MnmE/TrmE [Massilia sp. UYP32]|uniref:GTPase n=1 Tax=Massilia sp. UYP32 TaxID=1756386 RepID=UPI003D1FDD8A
MSINTTQLLDAYEQTRTVVADHPDLAAQFAPVETMFEDKKGKADAVVMVYGVYNAGKSTLINALIGREAAAVDDVPKTDTVTAYQWGSYSILDTPGVDAPIEHEQVTRAQMLKADAVVFVVDPLGTVEEEKTLEVLLDMIEARKQIYLVFNEKKPVSPDTFVHLKDQVRARLQAMAGARGLSDVLKEIPISKVNARRALQGIVKGQPLMVELSDFPAFEQQLKAFLQGIGTNVIYGRLKRELQGFLEAAIEYLQLRSETATVKKYDRLLQRINAERARFSRDMARVLARQRSHVHEMSKVYLRTAPQECHAQLEQLLHKAGEQVSHSLESELQAVVSLVQAEIDEFQVSLPHIGRPDAPGAVPEFGDAGDQDDDGMASASGPAGSLPIKETVQQLGGLAKPEHIVSGLKVIKKTMPSLMKGIGTKTMEKWGAAIVGKWIPYVGLAASIGEGLYTLLKGDPEAERLRKLHEEQQRARERAVQQMEDFAHGLAEGFENSMAAIVAKESTAFFGDVNEQVAGLRAGFSEAEQANSRQMERVLGITRQVTGA